MTRPKFSWLGLVAVCVLIGTVLPFLVIIPSSFTSGAYLTFPPQGFSLEWYARILDRPEFVHAFGFSLQLASVTAVLATIIGTLAAIAMSKYSFPGKAAVNGALLSPLVLPALILGIALLMLFSRIGIAGTFIGLLLAHLLITVPFVIRLVLTGLSGFDYNIEKAASILGASPLRVFWTVTIPLIKPAIFSGGIFAFLVSFDNVTISLFLVSNKQTTLPIVIFNYIQDSLDPMIAAVSTIVIVVSLVPIVLIERFYGLSKLFGLSERSETP
ncbi:MAG: ABC-type spermidine/putrescine transport system, permease [Microbacteriaceae bacterium]|jgi:putative spermidine/putrescine transport system permease protein|nr:ABC-type spermidine/putrescine transport system, permease [Microbacteriaceae bacterium]